MDARGIGWIATFEWDEIMATLRYHTEVVDGSNKLLCGTNGNTDPECEVDEEVFDIF
jgi:hypothetical protein